MTQERNREERPTRPAAGGGVPNAQGTLHDEAERDALEAWWRQRFDADRALRDQFDRVLRRHLQRLDDLARTRGSHDDGG